MDSAIIAFLRSQKVLTLAVADKEAYAANCFYAFDENGSSLVFASDTKTKHMQLALQNPKVAGTIYDPDIGIDKIRGVQFVGDLRAASDQEIVCYFARFPFARAMRPQLWSVELTWVKMTDNRLGFGKKLIWTRR